MSSSETPTFPQPQSAAERRDAGVARRVVLSGLGLGALSVTAAACGSSGSTPAADTKDAASPAASEAATTGAAPEGGAALISLAKIPSGGTVEVTDPTGRKLLLTRTGDTVKALSAKCTHKGCAVGVKGKELVCPCHGSVFAPGTGAVRKGPADAPLPAVAVKVQDGSVVLGA